MRYWPLMHTDERGFFNSFVVVGAMLLSLASQAAGAADACSGCHPAESKLHQKTRMAHAMMRAPESVFAQNLSDRPLQESSGGFQFFYKRGSDSLAVTAIKGASSADGVIEWVLGAGVQGQTPIVKTAAGTWESRVSYFPELHQYGITIGQDGGPSATAEAALGRKLAPNDLKMCLGCHATVIDQDLNPVLPGIQCDRCHAGAEEHARGSGKPLNPGRLAAADQVRFCGDCHRLKAPVDDKQLENVRFQPLRLVKSRCYTSGKLACLTCHPAHQDVRRKAAAFYDEKCISCHDSPAPHHDERAGGDCIGCHMPYVQLHPALKFTDHFIRVVKPGDLPGSILRQRETGTGTNSASSQ
jgi:Cytochrome c554 and c-prime